MVNVALLAIFVAVMAACSRESVDYVALSIAGAVVGGLLTHVAFGTEFHEFVEMIE
ncbi:MAG: hypothetical protein Kow0069_13230 [Promethearchaeota archaeon]